MFKYIHIQICIHARFGFLYISSTCFLSWGHSPETEEPAKEAAERSPQVVPPPAWMQKRKAVPCHDLKQICTFQVFFIHIYIYMFFFEICVYITLFHMFFFCGKHEVNQPTATIARCTYIFIYIYIYIYINCGFSEIIQAPLESPRQQTS